MSEQSHLASAYSFSIAADDAFAILRLGRRKYRVQVTEFSWAGFTISVPQTLAKRFKSGLTGTLCHLGSVHPISLCETRRSPDGELLVALSRQSEKHPRRRAVGGASKAVPRHVNSSDPLLTAASGICILLLLLSMPGWGESWGTSKYFSDGLRTLGQAITQVMHAFRMR